MTPAPSSTLDCDAARHVFDLDDECCDLCHTDEAINLTWWDLPRASFHLCCVVANVAREQYHRASRQDSLDAMRGNTPPDTRLPALFARIDTEIDHLTQEQT